MLWLDYIFFGVINEEGAVVAQNHGPLLVDQLPDMSGKITSMYTNICCDDKCIYAQFNGSPENSVNTAKAIIHVFDWQCNPIAQLNLDHDVMDFVITEDAEEIITISNETGSLVSYELPKL